MALDASRDLADASVAVNSQLVNISDGYMRPRFKYLADRLGFFPILIMGTYDREF